MLLVLLLNNAVIIIDVVTIRSDSHCCYHCDYFVVIVSMSIVL